MRAQQSRCSLTSQSKLTKSKTFRLLSQRRGQAGLAFFPATEKATRAARSHVFVTRSWHQVGTQHPVGLEVQALMAPARAPMGWDSAASVACLRQTAGCSRALVTPFWRRSGTLMRQRE
jgi:hypothetical protein